MDVRRAGLLAERPLHDELVAALRRRRLPGAVVPASVPTELRAVLAVRDERLLVLSRAGASLEPGPSPQELVDQLAAELGCAVAVVDLDHDDDQDHDGHHEHEDLLATSWASEEPAEDHHEAPVAGVPGGDRRTVHVVHGPLPLDGGRDAELAATLGSGVWVVPGADATIVVPDHAGQTALWWRAQRPVVSVTAVDGHLELDAYLAHDLHGARRRERRRLMATPGDSWWVDRPSTPLLDVTALAALSAADRQVVDTVQADPGAPVPEALDDLRPLVVELGLDEAAAATLRDVVGSPWTDATPDRLAAALGLTAATADVLSGRATPGDLDGAVRIEPHTWRAAAGAAALAEPSGTSWWNRFDAVFRRRPALAVARAVLWLAVSSWVVTWGLARGGALGAAAVVAGLLLATSCLVDAAIALRGRRRHSRARQDGRGD